MEICGSNKPQAERPNGDAHLSTTLRSVDYDDQRTNFVMTGKATSIEVLRSPLFSEAALPSCLFTKANWALGKKGLD